MGNAKLVPDFAAAGGVDDPEHQSKVRKKRGRRCNPCERLCGCSGCASRLIECMGQAVRMRCSGRVTSCDDKDNFV
jgi:hypothetical protein